MDLQTIPARPAAGAAPAPLPLYSVELRLPGDKTPHADHEARGAHFAAYRDGQILRCWPVATGEDEACHEVARMIRHHHRQDVRWQPYGRGLVAVPAEEAGQ